MKWLLFYAIIERIKKYITYTKLLFWINNFTSYTRPFTDWIVSLNVIMIQTNINLPYHAF